MLQEEEIISTLKQIGAAPLKQLGQHFLICPETLEKIELAGHLKKEDLVLEVGPGLGVLTEKLAQKCHQVIALEKDRKYWAYLKNKFKGNKRVVILNEDALTANLPEIIAKQAVFCRNGTGGDERENGNKEPFENNAPLNYKIVANLPYNIATRFIRLILASSFRPSAMTLLIQKEVAERICAKPPNMNSLALFVQLLSRPKIEVLVSRECFFPKPKVESAVINLENINRDLSLEKTEIKNLLRLVEIGFSSPRKTLFNNLSNVVELERQKFEQALQDLGKNKKARAQELNQKEWEQLSSKLSLFLP